MKLFLHYLRSKALKIGAFLLFALLFLVSFRLYHLPLAAVWYPSALCAALGLVILLLDFRRVRQRHLELQQILKSLPTLPQTLPQPQAVLEEDYRALTRALLAQQRTLETQLNSRYQDMLDYYTLWAHQIKTPVASMRLSLQQEDTPKARQLLQELSRAEQYVGMVMVYLRLTDGGSDFVLRTCDLDAIVRQAVRRFAGEFITRKLKLCYEPLNAACVTDEKWLLFVVEQVLSNALKYTREGSITITMEHPKTLVIRDTGIGIAPEDLPRIFERATPATTAAATRRPAASASICAGRSAGSSATPSPSNRPRTKAPPSASASPNARSGNDAAPWLPFQGPIPPIRGKCPEGTKGVGMLSAAG